MKPADLLHRIDFIEKAGTGIRRIRDEARAGGYPEPVWETNGFTTTIFRPNPKVLAVQTAVRPTSTGQLPRHGPDKYPTSTRQVMAALSQAGGPLSRAALQAASQLRNREHFVNEHLKPLVAAGLIELTIPDKPRSSRQRYRLTAAGRELLKHIEESK